MTHTYIHTAEFIGVFVAVALIVCVYFVGKKALEILMCPCYTCYRCHTCCNKMHYSDDDDGTCCGCGGGKVIC
jgi:hypothetical protein